MKRCSTSPAWFAVAPGLGLLVVELLSCGCANVTSGSPPAGSDAGVLGVTLDGRVTNVLDAARADLLTSGGAVGGSPDGGCASRSAVAEQLPLDLFVMMDSSGSMLDVTASQVTKWDAVKTALAAFFNDPLSQGISVGLQYFPQVRPNVPDTCLANAECGSFGPCFRIRTCTGTSTVALCATDVDCPRGGSCVLLGACASNANLLCAPPGTSCLTGDTCLAIEGYCTNRDNCETAAYSTPAVTIGALPAAAAALVASLNAREPDGLTPTAPALSGAIAQARQHALANRNRKAAVLLVTDGFPSECTPGDIAGIATLAAAGAAATPSIPTFVIGVFAPEDAALATENLNTLAREGATGRAVVISTQQNVTQVLQTALNQIRTTAVSCEYQIPPPTMGAIDFTKVNVQFTRSNGATLTVGYVRSKAACDPTRGGWHYNVDPASGEVPTAILSCDATCSAFRADVAGRVDIVLGCQTSLVL